MPHRRFNPRRIGNRLRAQFESQMPKGSASLPPHLVGRFLNLQIHIEELKAKCKSILLDGSHAGSDRSMHHRIARANNAPRAFVIQPPLAGKQKPVLPVRTPLANVPISAMERMQRNPKGIEQPSRLVFHRVNIHGIPGDMRLYRRRR